MSVKKKPSPARFDSHHVRLKEGEHQRENGTYGYRWTDKIGTRHSIYAPTLEELREKEKQTVIDEHDGIRNEVKNTTVNDVYALWAQMKRGIKDSTFQNYVYMYEMFIKPSFGKEKIIDVRKSDVRKFYNTLVDSRGLKISTLDGIHNILHQVFQVAVDDEMIRGNPTDNMLRELKLARQSDSEKRQALTMEQQKLFLNYITKTAKYQHWYPVFFIMLNTGMRVGEITGLRWEDINFETGMISVNHTLVYYNHRNDKGCYYTVNTPKTKAGVREIPMTDAVREAFQMEKDYQNEVNIKCSCSIDGYTDFVFINKDGNVQNQSTLNKAIKRIMRDCNAIVLENRFGNEKVTLLPDFTCHVLRHTFATSLCFAGMNVKCIQSLMGHADISTTMDIYVSVTNEMKKKEMAVYETFLEANNQTPVGTAV